MRKIIIRKHLLWTIISFFLTQTLQHSAEWKVKWLPKKQYGWKQNLFSLSEANIYKMVKWKLNEILKCRWHRSVWDERYDWAKKRLADQIDTARTIWKLQIPHVPAATLPKAQGRIIFMQEEEEIWWSPGKTVS